MKKTLSNTLLLLVLFIPNFNYGQFVSNMGIGSRVIVQTGSANIRELNDTVFSRIQTETTIHFAIGSALIEPKMKRSLDSLAEILTTHPDMHLEASSHTDSRASDHYNFILSQKRGESTQSYFLSKGISRDRIKVKSYGEKALTNNCNDETMCTENEQRQNRRVEMKIIDSDKFTGSGSMNAQFPNIVYHVLVYTSAAYVERYNKTNCGVEEIFYEWQPDGNYRYYSGLFSNREEAENHLKNIRKKGLRASLLTISNEDRVVNR